MVSFGITAPCESVCVRPGEVPIKDLINRLSRIEGQIRECRAFAKRNGFTVVGEYADRALTGRTDRRPDFQRMMWEIILTGYFRFWV